ncbi:MAG: hypothetical protein QOE06_3109 [Thermoleophilaceae bacterium]|jgi:hypothetical protein|nr:hypothetical protein [Thermoleophilaceae bacterium]
MADDAFIALPDPDSLGRPANHPYNFGFTANMGRLLAAHPRIGRAFQQLFSEIMFSPEGALSRQEREMVAAVAAYGQECFY